jgi:hypothetical protein
MKTLGAVLAFLVPGVAVAQDGRSVTTPDQRGHRLKMTRELVRLGTTKDPRRKVELFVEAGNERLRELEAMQAAGRTSHHDTLGRCYDLQIRRGAAGAIEIGAEQGLDMTGSMARYAEATSKHSEVLLRVLSKAPEPARQGLQRALEVSRRGHEQAAAAHQKGKGKSRKEEPVEGGRGGKEKGGPPPGRDKEKDKEKGGPPPDKGKPKK